ncbi:hypothetical protein FEM48_Zijuj06G0213400 [Ziziphus jujuba var. spinosa]|uniref:Uncharacterized protein n=1 Tax=Ziziphus jujuba var. spinosa TaxID=714518 RepID=A0A978VBP6_ZIZJJ|nr:hypothetical protein FEM48_Zijuj06G0213400 [Ziziphus jujuba var. spinosa]
MEIRSIDDIQSLPQQAAVTRNLSSLQSLYIEGSSNLTSLLEVMGNLSSLQSLHIEVCPKLTSLPEAIGNLSSLRSLRVEVCCSLTSVLPFEIDAGSSAQPLITPISKQLLQTMAMTMTMAQKEASSSSIASSSSSFQSVSKLESMRFQSIDDVKSLLQVETYRVPAAAITIYTASF